MDPHTMALEPIHVLYWYLEPFGSRGKETHLPQSFEAALLSHGAPAILALAARLASRRTWPGVSEV